MTTHAQPGTPSRFCTNCGTALKTGAGFCHMCGSPVQARAGTASAPGQQPDRASSLRWAVPGIAFLALVVLVAVQYSSRGDQAAAAGGAPLGAGPMGAPDISSMSPQERADRLFNRVMLLTSEGKPDSAAFFAPMAMSAIGALAPLNAHLRYDLGLVALVAGDATVAAAQADSILLERPNHLLGFVLAARAADTRGDAAASVDYRRRLRAAESAERAAGLQEYTDHDADIRAALTPARAG